MKHSLKVPRALIIFAVASTIATLTYVVASQAAVSRKTEVLRYDTSGQQLESRTLVFPEGFQGGASLAVADMDLDGDDDYVMGAGPGGGPQVVVMDADGRILANFTAYGDTMREGVNVAVGDLNNDGKPEIATVPAYGPAHVRLFDRFGNPSHYAPFGWDAFNGLVRHGATVALADRNDDGRDEIYVGSGSRTAGHVRGFDRTGAYIGVDYFPFASTNRGGVQVIGLNVNGGPDELAVAVMSQNGPRVKVYTLDSAKTVLGDFEAFPSQLASGVRIASADVDSDSSDELLISAGPGSGNHTRIFEAHGELKSTQIYPAFESDFRGGTWPAAGDFDGDGELEFAFVPTRLQSSIAESRETVTNRGGGMLAGRLPEFGKAIEVDLSEQRLYAFEDARVVNSFLISSGIAAFPTPEGAFTVDAKIFEKAYIWTYGPDDPANYNLPNVKHNLRFSWPYYIHGAYWHNNFGRPMSHGCVNMDEPDAEWMYDWTPVGTPVLIHD